MPHQESPEKPAFLLLHHGITRVDLFVFAALAICLGIVRLDGILSLSTHVIGGVAGDAGLYFWLIHSNTTDLFHLPWFTTRAFFPYTGTLAWSDNFILPAAIAYLLELTGFGRIVSFNLVLLMAQLLNGVCTYLLLRRLIGHQLIAFYGGLAFMTWPFLTEHLGHPQLQFAFWLPLSLTLLVTFVSHPRWAAAVLWGLSIGGAFLSAVYYAIFSVLLSAGVLLLLAFSRRSWFSRGTTVQFLLGAAGGLLPLIPFLLPYFDTLQTFQERQIHEPYYFAANLLSYVASTSFNLLYSSTHILSHAEARLFPGIVLMLFFIVAAYRFTDAAPLRGHRNTLLLTAALAALLTHPALDGEYWRLLAAFAGWLALGAFLYFIVRLSTLERNLGFNFVTNRTLIGIFIGIALLFTLLSFGPLGKTWEGEWGVSVYRFFYEFVPGVSAARALGRIGIVVILAVIITAALGLKFLLEQKKIHPLLILLACVVTFLENFPTRYPIEAPEPTPSAFQFLADTPASNAAVLVLPFTDSLLPDGSVESWGNFARKNVQYMLWAEDFRGYLVNGYSGQRSWIMKNLPRDLRGFPNDKSLRSLARIAGLQYIMLATDLADPIEREAKTQTYELYRPALHLIFGDEAGNLLFEFSPTVRADREFTLLAPARGPQFLRLEIFANYSPTELEVPVTVILPDFGDRVLAARTIRANREDETIDVELPQGLTANTPIKIGLRAKDDYPIYLRRSRLLDARPDSAR
jgi:hypothetical protein